MYDIALIFIKKSNYLIFLSHFFYFLETEKTCFDNEENTQLIAETKLLKRMYKKTRDFLESSFRARVRFDRILRIGQTQITLTNEE